MNLQVSVVIPTFNRARLLKRCIDSCLNQEGVEIEILVVDDGSSDSTREVLEDYRSEKAVRIFVQKNMGVSAARNWGIRQARFPWVAFLDSDDEWKKNKLIKQLQKAHESNCLIVHSDEDWIRHGKYVNQKNIHKKRGGWIFHHCLPLCCISPSAVVIHRQIFEDVGYFDECLPACEDYDLWLRICSKYPVAYVDEPLLKKYGGHDDQLSRMYVGIDQFRIQALDKILKTSHLNNKDRQAVWEMREKKRKILEQGAYKHRNSHLIKFVNSLPKVSEIAVSNA